MSFLYLMRHAKAEPASSNPRRPLTHFGLQQVRSTAALARGRLAEVPLEILHSPKERARQTAEALAQALGWQVPLQTHPGLEPDADPGMLAEALKADPRTVMLVGHLPGLPRLASLILEGRDDDRKYSFTEAALRCLERTPKGWKEAWLVEPRPPDIRRGE
jgi:phosphohistidine phosphatase